MTKRLLLRNPDFHASIIIIIIAVFVLISVRPQLFYKGDYIGYLTLERAVRDAFADGVLPMWNILYSEHLLGNPQAAAFYLPLILLRLLPLYPAMEISLILHVALAGVGSYFLLRDCELRRSAAIFGSIAFMLSGTTIFRLAAGHVALVHALPWIAWCLFTYRRYLTNFEWRYLLLTSIFIALLGYSGHPQWSLIGMMIPGCYFFFFLISNWGDWQRIQKGVIGSILIGVFTIGLLMIQLLPSLEYISNTTRGRGLTLEKANEWSFLPLYITTLYAPFSLGELLPKVGRYAHEYAAYTGILTIGFAVHAVKLQGSSKRPLAYFFGIMIVIAILLSVGASLPFYRFTFWLSRGLFRIPGRFMLIFTTCLPYLAAIGFDSVLDYVEARSYCWQPVQLFSLGLGLIGCMVAPILAFMFINSLEQIPYFTSLWYTLFIIIISGGSLIMCRKLKANKWQWVIVGILIIDMIGFTVYAAHWDFHNWETAYDERFSLRDVEIDPAKIRMAVPSRERYALSAQGVPIIFKHEGTSPTIDKLMDPDGDVPPTMKWLSALFYIFPLMEIPEAATLVDVYPNASIYEDSQNLPRIYAVSQYVVVSSEQEALDLILGEKTDPRYTVVTFDVVSGLKQDGNLGNQPEFSYEFLAYNAQTIEVRATTDRPSMVVFSEPFSDEWQATVDGEVVRIFRVNYALRGVVIEEGSHTIRMTIKSPSFYIGAIVTGFTIFSLLVITLWKRRQYEDPF